MEKFILILFISVIYVANAQQNKIDKQDKYLEDQFFIGISYNLLTNKPSSINLRGFSNTMSFGYIKDIPLNKNRNIGFGVGLGYSNNTFFHNMKIVEENSITTYSDFEDIDDFDSNKLIFHSIDLPIEFRIRKSTLENSKFWRLYLGAKFSYAFYHKSQFNLNGIQKYSNFDKFNKLQYGLTTSVGHGTWNGYLYYGLTNLFDNVKFNNSEKLNTKSIKIGLIFYVL